MIRARGDSRALHANCSHREKERNAHAAFLSPQATSACVCACVGVGVCGCGCGCVWVWGCVCGLCVSYQLAAHPRHVDQIALQVEAPRHGHVTWRLPYRRHTTHQISPRAPTSDHQDETKQSRRVVTVVWRLQVYAPKTFFFGMFSKGNPRYSQVCPLTVRRVAAQMRASAAATANESPSLCSHFTSGKGYLNARLSSSMTL
jgi:hypothetical protein